MKLTLISILLFCGAAGAQQPAAPAPAAKPNPEIEQVMKNLTILLERGGEIPAERLEALAPQVSAFNAKVKEALGEKILAEVARRERELDEKARAASAARTLQAFRAALQVAYTEAGGKYPKSPAELAPRVIQAVPELHLPGHERTNKIKLVDSRKYDADISKAVSDSGGWLFFSNPESANYGLLVLDCSHPGEDGQKFYEY
ncbi:MAG: hypothetical protein A2X32_13585 [Elusimicrobia bacterium GWC2_64_44]|nr:MAG: hypothetical protein A2X32_13585 [Elusimicrobia bacterium GWC2_64_44]